MPVIVIPDGFQVGIFDREMFRQGRQILRQVAVVVFLQVGKKATLVCSQAIESPVLAGRGLECIDRNLLGYDLLLGGDR